MPLTLLAGPANAGKVALLLDRYLANLGYLILVDLLISGAHASACFFHACARFIENLIQSRELVRVQL